MTSKLIEENEINKKHSIQKEDRREKGNRTNRKH